MPSSLQSAVRRLQRKYESGNQRKKTYALLAELDRALPAAFPRRARNGRSSSGRRLS